MNHLTSTHGKAATIMRQDNITMFDEFPVREYEPYNSLSIGDTVFVTRIRRSLGGYWAEVTVDFYPAEDDVITVREFGESGVWLIEPHQIKYERIHECECGAYGPDSWRICHPDA